MFEADKPQVYALAQYDTEELISELLDRHASLIVFGERKTNNPAERYVFCVDGNSKSIFKMMLAGTEYIAWYLGETDEDHSD
jgi:hypothetical protein